MTIAGIPPHPNYRPEAGCWGGKFHYGFFSWENIISVMATRGASRFSLRRLATDRAEARDQRRPSAAFRSKLPVINNVFNSLSAYLKAARESAPEEHGEGQADERRKKRVRCRAHGVPYSASHSIMTFLTLRGFSVMAQRRQSLGRTRRGLRYNRSLMTQGLRTRGKIPGVARACLSLLCLCVFAMALGGNVAEAAQRTSGGTSGFSPRFAIADFDGDRKPDLAIVQVVREAAMDSFYSIRLQLSTGEESAIDIAGPQGGLRISPRDVNGDDAIDLVVTTAMDSHFVAVLLNDGHGKFTLAKAGAFPGIESEKGMRLDAAQVPAEECAALQLTRSTFGIEAPHDAGTGLEHKSKFPLATDGNANLPGVRPGKSGRSPPVSVFHS